MPVVATLTAAPATTTASTTATAAVSATTRQASRHVLKRSSFLPPALIAGAAAYRYKHVVVDGCSKVLGAQKRYSNSRSFAFQSNLIALPKLSTTTISVGHQQQLHACSSKDKPFSSISAASTSFFGGQVGSHGKTPTLPRLQRSLKPLKAYKHDFFSFKYPVLTEKPTWWWRTLACVPYLIALQISDAGYYLQPLLERYDFLGDLIYFVPGAITRLPVWFSMVYIYFAYIGIVKNKDWPHFFRFHLMMGMLLETALQIIWYTSNFFPLIHYKGKFGVHYWGGIGFAYILLLLQCVRCALAGGYASIPVVSNAAFIHTLFNIGGYQRPF